MDKMRRPDSFQEAGHRPITGIAKGAQRPAIGQSDRLIEWTGPATAGMTVHSRVPILACSNSGLTSAPRWPHDSHTMRGSRSDSRTSSGHRLESITTWWLHSGQCAVSLVGPLSARMRPRVIFSSRLTIRRHRLKQPVVKLSSIGLPLAPFSAGRIQDKTPPDLPPGRGFVFVA